MAAMTLEPRDPDMSRFIDQYKFERQMDERRNKFGGGTSLPLNSDGYEDRQRFLKEERHKDWVEYQEKQRKLEQERIEQRRRNRPPPAQPQTNAIDYNEARELANTEDRRAYQDYQKAKEERYRAMRGRPVTPPGQGLDVGQYDRHVRETKAQKTKEYKEMLDQQQKEQMYMKAQRENEMAVLDRQCMAENQYPAGKPPAGPGYKPRDEAFQTNTHSRPRSRSTDQGYVPSLSDAPVRGKLYDDRSRPPQRELLPPNSPHRRTPPPRTPPPRNREFEDQKETFQTKQRRHSPPPRTPVGSEQSVNQSRPPRRRSPPPRLPPGPGSEQSDQSHPNYADLSPRRRKVLDTDESQYDKMRKTANIERKEDYNRYIREKYGDNPFVPMTEDDRRRQLSNRPTGKPAEVVKGPYYSSDNYESYQAELRRKQLEDYKEFLQKTSTHAPKNRNWKESENGLLLPEDHTMEYRKRELQNQRKKEYQEHLAQKKAPPNHYWPEPDPGRGALWLKKGGYEGVREMYDEERKKEFMDDLEKKQQQSEKSCNPRPKSEPNPGQSEYEKPIVEALGRYEELREKLKEARKKEFVEFLDKQRMNEVPRRDDYGSNVDGPYDGMFHGLGERDGNKDALSHQRRQEYNDRLEQQYLRGDRPTGRPSWAKDPVTDQDYGDRGRSPLKSPGKADRYEQMLHEKRREEAQRRRYDDPEYQDKLARMESGERGPARDQARYGY